MLQIEFLNCILILYFNLVMYKILESSGRQVKEAITNKTAQILATYRKHCASPSSAGQLILPECMKLMPLYVNCLIKCDAMSGGMLFIVFPYNKNKRFMFFFLRRS